MVTGKNFLVLFLFVLLAGQIAGCDPLRSTSTRSYLPKGSIEKGKAVFVDLKCYQCHTVAGTVLRPPDPTDTSIYLDLGGKINRVDSFSRLVTSIVNPNHIISGKYLELLEDPGKSSVSESPMPSLNDEMTVTQLIDLATFLDTHYEKLAPEYKGYDYGYEIF